MAIESGRFSELSDPIIIIVEIIPIKDEFLPDSYETIGNGLSLIISLLISAGVVLFLKKCQRSKNKSVS